MSAIFLGLVGSGAELASPMVTREVLQRLGSQSSVTDVALMLVAVLILSTIVTYMQTVMLGKMAERVVRRARNRMLEALMGARIGAVRTAGEMTSRVTSDTTLIREAATSSVVQFVNGAIALVGSLVLMGYLDMMLLMVTVIVVAVGTGMSLVLMPQLSRLQQQVQEHLGLLGGRLDSTVRAMRTVKASRAEQRELEALGNHVDDARSLGVRAVRIETAASTLTSLAMNVVIIVVLVVGGWRVSTAALDVPSLVAFLLYVFGLALPVVMIITSIATLQSGLAASRRIAEVTSLAQETDAPGACGQPPGRSVPSETVLELRSVTVHHAIDSAPALDAIDLDLPRQGHVALVGPSGAGKTTLLSALLRFLNVDSGNILLDGIPYENWTIEAVRTRIGYVEQDTPVIAGTTRDNVLYSVPDAGDDAVWSALQAVDMAKKIRSLPHGLDSDIAAATLSGGERQRLAVARVLVSRPPVLLLDEATAQLDARTERAIVDAVRDLARTGLVVSVAHRLSTVMDADRIVVLDGGRIRATGTHSELLQSDDLYADLVAALRITTLSVPSDAV
nr:ABC transporter ATP-binding protein [Rhodococcus sp. 1168]